MHEIICPHCGKAFKIDEAGYADILKQVRDGAFEQQLHERLELADLDASALAVGRQRFAEKHPHLAGEVAGWDVPTLLSKLKLSRGGQLTRAALLLFGKDESAQFLPLPPQVSWVLKDADGMVLDVSIIGTSDKLTVANWYLGSRYHVEQFKTSDGKTLLDSQVQNLVSAMAEFAPPAAGQTTLSASHDTALAPVMAANWQ